MTASRTKRMMTTAAVALALVLGGTGVASANTVAAQENVTARSPVGECPFPGSQVPVFLPDSEDPSIYYECRHGVPVREECPSGLHFNPIINTCDFPDNVPPRTVTR